MAYKKNDIVKIITNQPDVHLMEMFGHCEFKSEEIKPREYIARIKSVIADGEAYVVSVISDPRGSVCILNPEEIMGQMDESELTPEQLGRYRERCHLDAPNVYDNDPSWLDESLCAEEKCKAVARKAMENLFPDEEIVAIERDRGFLLKKYIEDLDYSLKQAGEGKQSILRKKRDELESWFRKMRFKEYYAVKVAVRCPATEEDVRIKKWAYDTISKCGGAPDQPFTAPTTVTKYWLVAIDLHYEEVSIMRDGTERNHFFLSLGAEHDRLYHAKIDFAYECMK